MMLPGFDEINSLVMSILCAKIVSTCVRATMTFILIKIMLFLSKFYQIEMFVNFYANSKIIARLFL